MALKNLTPVSVTTRVTALMLAIKFSENITKDGESYQNRVVAVEAHRKKFNILKKSVLKRLLQTFC